MDIQAWIAATAPVVAVAAFVFSLLTSRTDQNDAEIRSWQRVVIYSLIEERGAQTFDELNTQYLLKAQQLLSNRLPRKEIQDDSLRRILLDLQKDGVVVRRDDLTYQVQLKVPFEAWAFDEMKHIRLVRILKPKILSTVEGEREREREREREMFTRPSHYSEGLMNKVRRYLLKSLMSFSTNSVALPQSRSHQTKSAAQQLRPGSAHNITER